jgi:hypothetical protein
MTFCLQASTSSQSPSRRGDISLLACVIPQRAGYRVVLRLGVGLSLLGLQRETCFSKMRKASVAGHNSRFDKGGKELNPSCLLFYTICPSVSTG